MERVRINKENNNVVLTFNDRFYPQEFINRSIEDFKSVCDAELNGQELILKPKSREVDINIIGYEFYNYLLSLIKS